MTVFDEMGDSLIKNFLVNTAKGLCYLALYLASQTIASYMVVFITAFSMGMQNPSLLDTDAGLNTLIGQVYDATFSNSSLILILAAAILFLILVVFFRARGKRLTQETWLMPVRVQSLWPVVLTGAALALVICYGITWIPWPESFLQSYEELYALSNDDGILCLLATVLVAPVVEELVFRGLVFTRFCRAMPAPAALILASTIFGAMHGTLLWAAYGFIGGVAMTLVFMKYRSLYASMLLHCVFNIVGGYLIAYLVLPSALYDIALFGLSVAVLAVLSIYMYRMPRTQIDRAPKPHPFDSGAPR